MNAPHTKLYSLSSFLSVWLLLLCLPMQAQTLSGIVIDAETGKPMEAVMVSVLRGGQMMHLTFGIDPVDLRLSGEHYRNDLGNGTHLNTVLADAALIYKVKKWRLEAELNNLFNKREYAYTIYSTTQSYTSRLDIRPREVMVKANLTF